MGMAAIDMTLGGATLAACPVSALFLSFLAYGFIGWLWESTVCAMLNQGHFANSGFLLGPCCPIYGVGGICCWLLLRGIEGLPQQFVAAALVCSAIEYLVSVLLEKVTHARFWDYSYLPFNLHGRICLYWACVFGLGALAVCRAVQPFLLLVMGALPAWLIIALAVVLAVVLAVDTAAALASWRRLSGKLEDVRCELAERIDDSLHAKSDSMLEKIPDNAIDSAAQAHVRGRAINGWLSEISGIMLDVLREKAEMPEFASDGARGLALVARRVSDAMPSVSRPDVEAFKERLGEKMPHPVRRVREGMAERMTGRPAVEKSSVSKRPVPSIFLSRRDLRFFNAFPYLRMNRYEGVIRATGLRERARELFRR